MKTILTDKLAASLADSWQKNLDIEKGRYLFAQNSDFIWGAASVDSLPPPGLPEIAVAGRSNVGKSSLINAITGRTSLARVSKTPGRTQQINFFDIGQRFVLVDLPGYGFAAVGKKMLLDWGKLITAYLKGRVELKHVLVLIDARQGVKPVDEQTMTLLDQAAVPYWVILTKIDHLKPDELQKTMAAVQENIKKHPAAFPHILPSSSRSGEGIEVLRSLIADFITR
ncbi:MAG: ribosome biogenesis GTP-binding protein YihA/YsxC [Alphaproteobacteria bacterium]